MIDPITCPTRRQWLAFKSGHASQSDLDHYAKHLETCPSCGRLLDEASLQPDGVLRALRLPPPVDSDPDDAALGRLLHAAARIVPPSSRGATNRSGSAPSSLEGLSRFGPFELGEIVGSGSFGVVYRAIDTRLNREVALKLPRSDVLLTMQLRRRFLWEAQACARLDHPNLVAVFEAGEIDELLYIATGFCQGPTLAEWLNDRGPMAVRVAAQLVAALAEGVQHAHARGVIHRDIKPSNILLEPSQTEGIDFGGEGQRYVAKLADFGLAKPVGHEPLSLGASTRSWALMGTLEYMAPEVVAAGSKAADTRGDVYALGVVLYQLLVGHTPFQGKTVLQTLRQIERDEAMPPRRLRREIPRDLQTICLKCLTKSPSERYATAEFLAEDLRKFLGGKPVVARPAGPVGRLARWARRRPAVATLVALCLIGTLATMVGLSEHNRRLGRALARADASERTAWAHLYAANIRLASQALDIGDFVRCRDYLDRCRPVTGGGEGSATDMRGFEWRFLMGLLPFKPGKEVLEAHQSGVTCVTYSPDGSRLATCGLDGKIKLWSSATNDLIFALDAHAGDVNKVAFSPDGQWLVSGGDDGRVRVWNIAAKSKSLDLKHAGRVFEVAFSQDGQYLISAGDGKFIRLWDSRTGEPAGTFLGNGVTGLAVSSNSALIATAHQDLMVRIWDVFNMTLVATGEREHLRDIDDVAFSPDGGRFATASRDHTARIWNAGTGDVICEIEGHLDAVHAVSFSPDGKLLATASRDNTIRLWDHEGRQQGLLRGHDDVVWSLAFAPAGDTLATASRDGTVRFWNVQAIVAHQKRVELPPVGFAGSHFAVLAPDAKTIATTTDVGAQILDTATLGRLRILTNEDDASTVTDLAFSHDGRMVAGASTNGKISIWNAKDGRRLRCFNAHAGHIFGIAFAPLEPILATCGEDFKVRLWDGQTAELRRELDYHTDLVRTIAFSPDGKLLASGGDDHVVVVWNLSQHRIQTKCRGARNVVSSLTFSPDSKTLAGGTHNGRIRRWDVQTGREIDTLIGHTDQITCVCYSPDGKTLVSGSVDRTVRFWQAETGQALMTVRDHIYGAIVSASFSPSSGLLLTSERGPQGDGRAFLWKGAVFDNR